MQIRVVSVHEMVEHHVVMRLVDGQLCGYLLRRLLQQRVHELQVDGLHELNRRLERSFA